MAGAIGNLALFFSALFNVLLIVYLVKRIKNNDFKNLKIINFFNDSIFFLLLISFTILVYCFVISDFSNVAVYKNSHTTKPLIYKISGAWGNHEGSMVLFILILSLFSFIFARTTIDDKLKFYTVFFQSILIFIFLIFLILTSNPFDQIDPKPLQGLGLNPILQDPLLAIHPPFLYFGYVGFSLVFSFALAGLATNSFDKSWSKIANFWIILPWSLLTIGIGLGSFWAYYELGWGGYWFWDPVENASLMPWLAATALIHSNIVTYKKDKLHSWTALLSIFTFIMSLLGTFLVRSGVLNSVHAFANDPYRGVYILSAILLISFYSLTIFIIKSPRKNFSGEYSFLQKDNFILINNCFLIFFLSVVLVGTVYPIILDAISGKSISVGPVYYHTILAPFLFVFLFFMSHGPLLSWNKEDKFSQIKNFLISHLGFGVLIFSIFVNAYLSKEINTAMKVGDEIKIQEFLIKFKSINKVKKENYDEVFGNFLVTLNDKQVELSPSIRKYDQPVQFTSETSIRSNLITDYYFAINLSEFEKDKIMVRFYYKPLMFWIWLSILLIAFGGIYQTFRIRNEQ
ncbi:MAG: heme lyase CcmF/NrfE family subunit [Candidatus Fonsibacter ubiquis]|nr:heme lyase CcmF/NrfE family subunit [Candidatus Fonsibacter ubiquis]